VRATIRTLSEMNVGNELEPLQDPHRAVTSPRRAATVGFRPMHRRLRFIAAAASLALAATSLTLANPMRAAAQGANTGGCPEFETKVAVSTQARRGSTVTVYKGPSTSSGVVGKPLRTLVDIKGRVVFKVLGQEGEFFKVAVPSRPNGVTGYVPASSVVTYVTPYKIEILLNPRSMKVFECGKEIISTRVAVGKPSAPTPIGEFFLVDLLRPPRGNTGPYGPFAFGISGFSNIHQSYGAGGDGRVGIHGTSAPSSLGSAVSDGCIRVDNAIITRMAKTLYLGSPVSVKLG
jgi:lipoprotein-anchoring transpeptidase ErfK/SrfK